MNKVMSAAEAIREIPDGATVAIGGSSLSRKPMALVRQLARSDVKDLRLVVDVGGPDVDLLIAMGKVREVIFAYVGFELMGLAPHFRQARQAGSLRFQEWTEYTVMAGLDASIKGVPFLPTHTGWGTDVLKVTSAFRTVTDPFTGEELVAVPAIRPDFALVHVNVADRQGNGVILGDGHVDELCVKAAERTILSAEWIADPKEIQGFGRNIRILRVYVDAVVEAPWGAHFTGCAPYYRADLAHVREYVEASRDEDAFRKYVDRFVTPADDALMRNLGGVESLVERLRV